MLDRAKLLTAILALAMTSGCAAGSHSDSEVDADSQYTEVEFEVPEGTGPIPTDDASKEECTTSCSLAHHAIPPFSDLDFEIARKRYAALDPRAESEPLEKLLFYGEQSREFLAELGSGELSGQHLAVLQRELSRKNAEVTLRMVGEEDNKVRAVYGPSLVPIGKKQHLGTVGEGLLSMQFNGTVMRTGVNYLWSRY